MKLSLRRFVPVLVVALALTTVGVQPATAANEDTRAVTIKGHVTEPDGTAVSGITVNAACRCDAIAPAGSEDRTDAKGFYSVRTERRYVDDLSFFDTKERYFAGRRSGSPKTTSTGFVIDAVSKRVSTISGIVSVLRGTSPTPIGVTFYDVKTLKRVNSASVRSTTDGKYVAHVPAGDYKIRFGENDSFVNPNWLSGGATSAMSPTVSVGYGGTVTGINGVVTPKPTISGTFTVDGQPTLERVSEQLRVSLVNAQGVEVRKMVTRVGFSFVDLSPGSYTIIARPTKGSSPFASPLAQTVQLVPGSAISNLVINLTSMTPSASSPRSTGIDFEQSSKGYAATGKELAGTIVFSSYGNVAGGKAAVYVNGKKVDTVTVPASGRVKWKKRLGTVDPNDFVVKVRYFGTDTTRSLSQVIYSRYTE